MPGHTTRGPDVVLGGDCARALQGAVDGRAVPLQGPAPGRPAARRRPRTWVRCWDPSSGTGARPRRTPIHASAACCCATSTSSTSRRMPGDFAPNIVQGKGYDADALDPTAPLSRALYRLTAEGVYSRTGSPGEASGPTTTLGWGADGWASVRSRSWCSPLANVAARSPVTESGQCCRRRTSSRWPRAVSIAWTTGCCCAPTTHPL